MQEEHKNQTNREHKHNMWRLVLSLMLLIILNIVGSVRVDAASSASFKLDPDPESGPSGTYASSTSFALNDQVDSLGTYAMNSSSSFNLVDGVPALEVYPYISSEEEEEEDTGGGSGHTGDGQTGPGVTASPGVNLGEGASGSYKPAGGEGQTPGSEQIVPVQKPTLTKPVFVTSINICPLESIYLDQEAGRLDAQQWAWASLNRAALRQYSYLLIIFIIILIVLWTVNYYEKRQSKKHSKKTKRKHS